MSYSVLINLHHDGQEYLAGSIIDLDEEAADKLLNLPTPPIAHEVAEETPVVAAEKPAKGKK